LIEREWESTEEKRRESSDHEDLQGYRLRNIVISPLGACLKAIPIKNHSLLIDLRTGIRQPPEQDGLRPTGS